MSQEGVRDQEYQDVTELFKKACSELSNGNYVATDDFQIDETVHAFEIMQPILDSGIDANKVKSIEERLEKNEIMYNYSIDDLIDYILMLAFEEDAWLVGWSLTRLLASYIPCYEDVLKGLDKLVKETPITKECNLEDNQDQLKFNRLFILTYTIQFIKSLKVKIALCKKARNVEKDSLDCYTRCYMLEDHYEFSDNAEMLLTILKNYVSNTSNKETEQYKKYMCIYSWLRWRTTHISLLATYLENPENQNRIDSLTQLEDKFINGLKESSIPYQSFQDYQKRISSELYDASLFKIVSINIPTNIPKYNTIPTILTLLSDSIHVYHSIYPQIKVENDFIVLFESLSHIIYVSIYPYTRAALYDYYITLFDSSFDWNTYLCKCFHINKNKKVIEKFQNLFSILSETLKETIHSICFLPHFVYRQLPLLLEQWARFYENFVVVINELPKSDPLYIYLFENEIQKNFTHFILNTCCYLLILYCFTDIYLKLSSKYDIGFMVWYLTLLITKVREIENKFLMEQQSRSTNRKYHKKFAYELSPFPVYINSYWIIIYTYLLSFYYIYVSSQVYLIQTPLYSYANESIRVLQKIAPVNKSPYLPIPTYTNYKQNPLANRDKTELFNTGFKGFSNLAKEISQYMNNETNWLRKKELSSIKFSSLKMSICFLKLKSKLNFEATEINKSDIHLELDELNMNLLPILQERETQS